MRDAILHSLRFSQSFLSLMTQDLSAEQLTHMPVTGSNPVGYIVGHLLWVERATLTQLKTPNLPAVDDAILDQFTMGKKPTPTLNYGDPTKLFPLWAKHRDITITLAGAATDEQLRTPVPQPFPPPPTLWTNLGELLNFVGIHTMLHAGQISAIRRSLGKPALF